MRPFKAAVSQELQFLRGKEKHSKYVSVTENTLEQCQKHLRLSCIRPFSSIFIAIIKVYIFLSRRQKTNSGKEGTMWCMLLFVRRRVCLKIEPHQWFWIRNTQCCQAVPNSHLRKLDSLKTANCSKPLDLTNDWEMITSFTQSDNALWNKIVEKEISVTVQRTFW